MVTSVKPGKSPDGQTVFSMFSRIRAYCKCLIDSTAWHRCHCTPKQSSGHPQRWHFSFSRVSDFVEHSKCVCVCVFVCWVVALKSCLCQLQHGGQMRCISGTCEEYQRWTAGDRSFWLGLGGGFRHAWAKERMPSIPCWLLRFLELPLASVQQCPAEK